MKIGNIVKVALITALCTVCTLIIHIRTPMGGYINLGDSIVILGGLMLGSPLGAIAGGFGSAFADLILGVPIYAPATLIIKAAMAFCASLIYQKSAKRFFSLVISAFVAQFIMVFGYFLYDSIIYSSFYVAVTALPLSFVQGLAGGVGAVVLTNQLKKNNYFCRQFPKLK